MKKAKVDNSQMNMNSNYDLVEKGYSKYTKMKFPPCNGSWKQLLKNIVIRQSSLGGLSAILTASIYLIFIGLPLLILVWVWTVEYIFYTRKEFPEEKQYLNTTLGFLALCPISYFFLFFLPCTFIIIVLLLPFGILLSLL